MAEKHERRPKGLLAKVALQVSGLQTAPRRGRRALDQRSPFGNAHFPFPPSNPNADYCPTHQQTTTPITNTPCITPCISACRRHDANPIPSCQPCSRSFGRPKEDEGGAVDQATKAPDDPVLQSDWVVAGRGCLGNGVAR